MSQNSCSIDSGTDSTLYNADSIPSQALDAARMRLSQLTHSLFKIKDEMSKTDLPQWYALQAQFNVVLTQLSSLTNTVQHFEEVLDSTVAYPLPSFPTTAHEGLLTTLLRKKNIPEVDDWIKNAKEYIGLDIDQMDEQELENIIKNDKEITQWASEFIENEHKSHSYQGFYTSEELSDNLKNSNIPIYKSYSESLKTPQPFNPNAVLKFIYQGDLDY